MKRKSRKKRALGILRLTVLNGGVPAAVLWWRWCRYSMLVTLSFSGSGAALSSGDFPSGPDPAHFGKLSGDFV